MTGISAVSGGVYVSSGGVKLCPSALGSVQEASSTAGESRLRLGAFFVPDGTFRMDHPYFEGVADILSLSA
jgi:hypothetical protein